MVQTEALTLAVHWRVSGAWYELQTSCGAGITTVAGPAAPALLRVLAGRAIPYTGAALLDGRPLRLGRDAALHGPQTRPIAAVLADDRLPRWCTPLCLVAGAVRLHGVGRKGARMRAAQALGWAGVTPFAYRPPAMLNVAQRRRVMLAAALAVVPGLLLLERPCAPLPPSEHTALYAILRELAARWEMVILLAPDSTFEGEEALEPQRLE